VFWMAARQPELLAAPERNYQQAMNLYGQFAGGTFVSDEDSRPGYADPRGGFETCGIVEFMHSFEMLTKISGNPLWADRAEEIAFNSFPAAETPDLKALHYLTCPNQVQLDRSSKAPAVENSGATFSYSPFEVYRCCQHNVSHGWPYYAEELWLATPDNGLAASLYAASELNARVGNGTQVKISEETEYPFQDTNQAETRSSQRHCFPALSARAPLVRQYLAPDRRQAGGSKIHPSVVHQNQSTVGQWGHRDVASSHEDLRSQVVRQQRFGVPSITGRSALRSKSKKSGRIWQPGKSGLNGKSCLVPHGITA